jgi:hypothetical protein
MEKLESYKSSTLGIIKISNNLIPELIRLENSDHWNEFHQTLFLKRINHWLRMNIYPVYGYSCKQFKIQYNFSETGTLQITGIRFPISMEGFLPPYKLIRWCRVR